MPKGVGVPSTRGIMDAGGDYVYGAVGGAVYNGASRIIARYTPANSNIAAIGGGLLAAAVAGATVKGNRGETIATIAGFTAGGAITDEILSRV